MKKFLAIFLLVLLPLQFSWAAVAGYCQHEAGVTANHPGHHTHDHQAADNHESGKDGTASAGVHHDCATCHLGCAAALTSDLKTPIASAPNGRNGPGLPDRRASGFHFPFFESLVR